MAKTSAGDLRATARWKASHPDAVRKHNHKYEVAHYSARKAAKAAWYTKNRLKFVNGIGSAAGLKMLRERERASKAGKA